MMSCEIEIIKTKKNSSLHWSESVLKKLAEDETTHQIHVAIRYDSPVCLVVSYKCIVLFSFIRN
jgi:hypothetical protein